MYPILEYVCMILISALLLEASRLRAGDLDPRISILLPTILWPIGLPWVTTNFIRWGVEREQYGLIIRAWKNHSE